MLTKVHKSAGIMLQHQPCPDRCQAGTVEAPSHYNISPACGQLTAVQLDGPPGGLGLLRLGQLKARAGPSRPLLAGAFLFLELQTLSFCYLLETIQGD